MRILLLLIIFIGIGFSQNKEFIDRNDKAHEKIEEAVEKMTDSFNEVMFTGKGGNEGLVTQVRLNTTFREEMSGAMWNITLLFLAQFIAMFGLRVYDHKKRRAGNGKL